MRHQGLAIERDPLVKEFFAMRFYPSAFVFVRCGRKVPW
jgi:hypothetical protein